MFRKVLVAVTFGICVTGLTFSTGCTGGPGKIQEGKANRSDFGQGVGTTADGEKLPDGMATWD